MDGGEAGVSLEDTSIDLNNLQQLLDSHHKLLLIDVRSNGEHNKGTIPASINIPLSELKHQLDTSDYSKYCRVIVFCSMGERSKEAVDILKGEGLKNVLHYSKGYKEWKKEMTSSED